MPFWFSLYLHISASLMHNMSCIYTFEYFVEPMLRTTIYNYRVIAQPSRETNSNNNGNNAEIEYRIRVCLMHSFKCLHGACIGAVFWFSFLTCRSLYFIKYNYVFCSFRLPLTAVAHGSVHWNCTVSNAIYGTTESENANWCVCVCVCDQSLF